MKREPYNRQKFLDGLAKRIKWETKLLVRKHGAYEARRIMEERYGWRGRLATLSLPK